MFLSFMPIYIPKIKARDQSINEILTINKYSNLIGRQPFLAITWETDFSLTCSFHRILMDHKNFHFKPIADKNNDLIFLKSPQTLFFGPFLTIFGHFCLMGIFSKNSHSVTHNFIWAPNTMLSFRKTNEPLLRKLMDRLKDGRKEGQTDPTS